MSNNRVKLYADYISGKVGTLNENAEDDNLNWYGSNCWLYKFLLIDNTLIPAFDSVGKFLIKLFIHFLSIKEW